MILVDRRFRHVRRLSRAIGVEPLAQLFVVSAKIAAASNAALIAPGLPIASVPTGTPPGI